MKAGNGVEASAGRVAEEELGAIREDGYGMGAERHVHAHAAGGILVAQRVRWLATEPLIKRLVDTPAGAGAQSSGQFRRQEQPGRKYEDSATRALPKPRPIHPSRASASSACLRHHENACNNEEEGQDPANGPRWSWATNQMGKPSVYESRGFS
jgi:hypothetical protein